MKWKTRNGEVINIKDMSDSHLSNSIRMLEREIKIGSLLCTQAYFGNSDAGEDAFNSEIRHNEVLMEDIIKNLKGLQKEETRRTKIT